MSEAYFKTAKELAEQATVLTHVRNCGKGAALP